MLICRFALASAACLVVAAPAMAQARKQPPGKDGTFQIATVGDWGAYVSGKERSKVCYAMSQPKDRAPKGLNRDPAYLFITHKGAGRFELSVIMGYPLKAGSLASALIGADTYELLTKEKSAWLKEENEEKEMVAAIRSSPTMTVKGTSIKGNDTTDRYSLAGAGAAIDRMVKECQ